MVSLTIDAGKVKALLGGITGRLERMSLFLEAAGVLILRSVDLNFRAGGRPKKWPARSPGYGRRMAAAGHEKTLIVSGDLLNSITPEVIGQDTLRVGSNLIYARVMQEGARKGQFGNVTAARRLGTAGRSGAALYSRGWTMPVPWGNIPARPYLLLQDEDERRLGRMAADYALKGKL